MEIKALVTGEEELIRWFLKKALNRFEYKTHIAGNTDEALSLLKDNSFNLLVTDIKNPESNGLSLIDKLRKFKIRIPNIIVCSSYSRDEFPDDLWADGVRFLQKPFNLLELKGLLGEPASTDYARSGGGVEGHVC
ncbi:hypothetical protein LCGC14_2239940 [marine sediment metagenome]|uniref:Response regulatory domain-containing protein n=1 Tax=marine sediment metagenome TaxID=412755 RepID=A0A0F9DTB6_9ZZZZ